MKYLRTYGDFVNEAMRPGKPYHGSKIIVFDLDDTLVITDAKIKVCDKKTGECYALTPEEFNEYEQPKKRGSKSSIEPKDILNKKGNEQIKEPERNK